jgi:hypothetical protein
VITVLGWTVIGALCGHPVFGLVAGLCLFVAATV